MRKSCREFPNFADRCVQKNPHGFAKPGRQDADNFHVPPRPWRVRGSSEPPAEMPLPAINRIPRGRSPVLANGSHPDCFFARGAGDERLTTTAPR